MVLNEKTVIVTDATHGLGYAIVKNMAALKFGLSGLTKAIAANGTELHIRASFVCPGFRDTG